MNIHIVEPLFWNVVAGDDASGCKREFPAGPQRKINQLLVGYFDYCQREVAVELDEKDERTGRSWLIEYTGLGG